MNKLLANKLDAWHDQTTNFFATPTSEYYLYEQYFNSALFQVCYFKIESQKLEPGAGMN